MTPDDRDTIEIKVRLSKKQARFRESQALYTGYVGGRGSGKSWAGAYKMCRRAKRGRTYLIASPTGVKLHDETFPTFRSIAQQLGIWNPKRVKLTPYPTVTLRTGAEIRFRTAEDPEKLRGPNLSGGWLDEGSLMDRSAFTVVIACLREGGELGWLDVTFTPKGRRHWTYQELATGKPNTSIVHATTWENPFIHVDFAKNLESAYTRSEADQEIRGMFLDAGDEFQVIPEEWIRAAMARWKPEGFAGRKLNAVGFDVAMGGECDNALAKRYGTWWAPIITLPGRQTPDGDSAAKFARDNVRGEEHALINVDTFGVGAEAYGSLCRLGLNCQSINFGLSTRATDRTGTLTFANLRSFAYWSLREILDPTKSIPNEPPPQLPPDDALLDELIELRWKPVGGQVQVEKKEEVAKRLGRSPDRADALANSILLPMAA